MYWYFRAWKADGTFDRLRDLLRGGLRQAHGRLLDAWRADEPHLTLQALADRLNARHRRTPRGQLWTPTQVRRALDRHRGV